jgi:hypothetical protein
LSNSRARVLLAAAFLLSGAPWLVAAEIVALGAAIARKGDGLVVRITSVQRSREKL